MPVRPRLWVHEKTLIREPFLLYIAQDWSMQGAKIAHLWSRLHFSEIFLSKYLQNSFFFCNFAADFVCVCLYA